MLLVEHSRCLEHGELVHGSDRDHHDTAAHRKPDSSTFNGAAQQPEDAHKHCTISADRRDAVTSVAGAASSVTDTAVAIGLTPTTTLIVASFNRFRLAPKNSPPA